MSKEAAMVERARSVALLDYFSGLEDPRQAGKVLFPLGEIMLVVLCGVLSGADGFVEIARRGKMNLAFVRRFSLYTVGIPSHDSLNGLPGDLSIIDTKTRKGDKIGPGRPDSLRYPDR